MFPHNLRTYYVLVGVLGHLRGCKEPPHEQVEHGRKGEGKEKWRLGRTGTPKGWMGKGRGVFTWKSPLTVGISAAMERDLQGINGLEGNMANVSLSCLGSGKPVEVLGLNSCLPEPPHSKGTNGDREGLLGD